MTEEQLEKTEDLVSELDEQIDVTVDTDDMRSLDPTDEETTSAESLADTSTQISAIETLQQQLKEAEEKNLRIHADFENVKKRMRQDAETAQKYRVQSLVTALLPALDNFERAMKVEPASKEVETVLQGIEMVYHQIQAALKEEGVGVIEAVGQPFDPNMHQAVMQVDEGHPSNEVIEEFQKGYMLKDRVIRASMVKVNE